MPENLLRLDRLGRITEITGRNGTETDQHPHMLQGPSGVLDIIRKHRAPVSPFEKPLRP
ncbi:hypothetical protein GCM10010365_23040 [Streptomyces poonensis]|uniref:Uncharacterized protein n=1 Tax=Streptomyces poonensis TaxID=68255 RepID=A0A918PFG5_9ACTN|nr:hypothetical protein GCM10010365_23040 [Streptomyces poonensis]GLJ90743.1 hypothetical protein GCM10017589_33480 [Streptomyces poonensis]